MQELPLQAVDRVLGEVLARPEFAAPGEPPLWRAVGAAWDWIWARVGDALEWLLPGLESASPAWSFVARAGLALLGLVGLGLLVHLALLWVGSVRRGRRGAPGGARGGPPVGPRSAARWERLARAAARDGRWRDAALALYQAVIHRLAGSDRIRFDPGKTPGDYRRELAGHPRDGPLLDRFVRQWEPVAFGRRTPDRVAWDELLELARALAARG